MRRPTGVPGDDSVLVPPDPFSNSVVKQHRADDSVRSPHAKVGQRQASFFKPLRRAPQGFFLTKILNCLWILYSVN